MVDRIQAFEENGYLVLPNVLSENEVKGLNRAIDRDLEQYPEMWKKGTDGHQQNANILLSSP